MKELEKLGIEDEISSYSYMKGNFISLEEDSDMSKYIEKNLENLKITNKHDKKITLKYF